MGLTVEGDSACVCEGWRGHRVGGWDGPLEFTLLEGRGSFPFEPLTDHGCWGHQSRRQGCCLFLYPFVSDWIFSPSNKTQGQASRTGRSSIFPHSISYSMIYFISRWWDFSSSFSGYCLTHRDVASPCTLRRSKTLEPKSPISLQGLAKDTLWLVLVVCLICLPGCCYRAGVLWLWPRSHAPFPG